MQSPEDREQRRVHIERSQVGGVGDGWHVEGGIHIYPEVEKPKDRWDYYRHKQLPPHYVERPEVMGAARAALLDNGDSMALTSAIQQAPEALHGMGGIGKTVVARALCEDTEVREAFSDGILWTTLGRKVTGADLRIKLREWIDVLGGMVSETAPTLDRLKAILAELLEDRTCLLIVDDVWRRTHAEVFQVDGPHCQLLITTRDAEIARGLGARLHPVNVMAREQAVALLEQWAAGKLDDTTEESKDQIVTRLGCLPLAVKLAGEQLWRHDPQDWLARFDARKLQSSRPEEIHDSLFQTFSLSLDDLSEEARCCYTGLAIFPEDESIPFVAVSKLWGALASVEEDDAHNLMYDLAARALVQLDETPIGPAITLHDLLRDFIADELDERSARDAHRALLDTYRATQDGEGWHTAPGDGYLYAHLAYHLDAVANHDDETGTELSALFVTDAWLRCRVAAHDYRYDGYLADLALAWQHAQARVLAQLAADQPSRAVAESVHTALIHTSVNTLATEYGPELVARAVETGLWSPARGMSVLRRIPDAFQRVRMAAGLLATENLSAIETTTATRLGLAAAHKIGPGFNHAKALAMLVPYLDARTRREALDKALATTDMVQGESRAKILKMLAPHLEGDQLAYALTLARADRRIYRANNLAPLIPHLAADAQQAVLTEALDAARRIEVEEYVTEYLGPLFTLSKYYGEQWQQLLSDILADAQAGADQYRVQALGSVIPCLRDEVRQQVLAEAWAYASGIDKEWYRLAAFAALAPYLEA